MQFCTQTPRTSRATIEPNREPPAPPTYFFSTHAYCCEFDEGAIILDILGDSYVGIDARHLANLRTRVGNWPDSDRTNREAESPSSSESDSLIADLLRRGILTVKTTLRQPSSAMGPATALTPSSKEARHPIPLTHVAQFSIALLMVAWRLGRNNLPALLDWIDRRQSSIHRRHSITREDAVGRIASFFRLRSVCYTARRRCLFDSLVLTAYLTREMVPCTFVIGVAIKPFLAHAWVQIGESVLNDTAEHAQDFRPILTIDGGG